MAITRWLRVASSISLYTSLGLMYKDIAFKGRGLDDIQPNDEHELADGRDAQQCIGKQHEGVRCKSTLAARFGAWRWLLSCRAPSVDNIRAALAVAKA